jgi:type I restriction enzyme S subunit
MMAGKYQAYSTYSDWDEKWFGRLPNHWNAAPVKFQCTFNDEVLSESLSDDYEIEYVDIGSVSASEGIQKTETIAYGKAPSRARRIVRDGDVIISTVRTYLEAIAPIECPPDNLVVSTGFAVIRPRGRFHKKYAAYALRAKGFIGEVVARSVGVSYPAINASELVAIYSPLPSLEEQIQIANFLDHETAKIDTLIDKQQQLIKLLKEKRQAVISQAVTKGLNPDAPMKDSGVEWLGEVPEHWIVRRLKHTAKLQSGIPKGKDLTGKNSIEVPMLRVANVQDGYLSLADVHTMKIEPHELDRYQLQNGDVLMNEGGDNDKLGRGAVWRKELVPCIHQNHVFAIRPENIEPEWLDTLTRAAYAKFHFYCVAKQSTNLASISSTNIKETPLLIPPGAERAAILTYLTNQFERFDLLEDKANLQVKLLQERRTALISAAVTGKIDVRNWQPAQTEIPMEASA